MCGFAGIIKQQLLTDDEFIVMLTNMADRIAHRGPDDSGIWYDNKIGLGFAHRRLSVIDLTDAGRQPMVSSSGRFIMAYNGEVYNFEEIRILLESQGYSHWCGHSDTEVILAAFEHWGMEKSLQMMTGMFAFALWDRQKRKLYLARDRMGEKPLYYGINNNTFFFGSDLRAFNASPFWRPEINPDALGLLMKQGYIPSPFSIFKGMHKLTPGTFIEIPVCGNNLSESDLPAPVPYWSFLEIVKAGLVSPLNYKIISIDFHNLYLTIFFQYGIIGAILYFSFPALLIKRIWSYRKKHNNEKIYDVLLLSIGIFLINEFKFEFTRQADGVLIIWIVFSLYFFLSKKTGERLS